MDLERLKQKAVELQRELDDVQTAIRVHTRYGSESAKKLPPPPPPPFALQTHAARDVLPLSSRDAIAKVLAQHPGGLTKDQLLALLRAMGRPVPPNTLIWSLSTYKDHFRSNGAGIWSLKT